MSLKKLAVSPELQIVFFSFVLNFLWEALQSSFFEFKYFLGSFALCMIYCASIDVLITTCLFAAVALLFKKRHWFLKPTEIQVVTLLFLSLVVNITIEYINVHIIQDWTYTPSMPVLFGIGLLPVLQWTIIPLTLIFIFRERT